MAGYVRNDTANNITDGNIINSADLDGEFDAIVAAFVNTTGHTHDGTAAEGAPITKMGPAQDLVVGIAAVTPKTDNTLDLGSSLLEFKDLYIDGVANIDSLVADTADINAGTIDGVTIGGASAGAGSFTTLSASSTTTLTGLTASQAVFTNASKELVSNAITGTGNVVMSASPTLTGTISGAAATLSGSLTLSSLAANGVLYLDGSKVATSGSALTFNGSVLLNTGSFAPTDGTNIGEIKINAATLDFNTSSSAVPQVFRLGSSEGMRLTSTGLGIGTSSPGAKLDVQTSGGTSALFTNGTTNQWPVKIIQSGSTELQLSPAITGNSGPSIRSVTSGGAAYAPLTLDGSTITLKYGGTTGVLLDASGNLGLGVTPSASWASGTRAFQFGPSSALYNPGSGSRAILASNAIFTLGVSSATYITSNAAAFYDQDNGTHKWNIAPSGTAGNAISFSQAMTLNASGKLSLGTTSAPGGGGVRAVISNANGGGLQFDQSGSGGAVLPNGGSAGLQFFTYTGGVGSESYTERARITSGGDLLVGTTAQPSGASCRQVVKYDTSDYVSYFWNSNASPYGVRVQHDTDTNGTGNLFLICVGNATERASIRSNGGIANYSANDVNLSDRREKTNLAPAKSYLDAICAIPVQTFNYIDQSEDDPGLTLGVVAQDVQAVAPELVMESNWGTEENPKMRLSIYQTDLQYALMKCVQELKAQNDELRARVAALETN